MGDNPEAMKKAMGEIVAGAYDLTPAEHRLDTKKFLEWFMKVSGGTSKPSEWNGYYLFPGFEAETAKHAYYHFQPKKGDVLVSTYSKTGTTWVTAIVRNILYVKELELLEKVKRLQQLYTYLEFGPVSKYQTVDNLQLPRRFLGTHLPAPLVNLEKLRENDTKVLYVIRNPKDQAVSWYHFAMSLPFKGTQNWSKLFPENKTQFIDLYVTGQQKVFAKEGEGYLEHVKGWYDHRNDSNVLFLVYEELKQDIHSGIRKIAKFIDVDLTDEEVDRVAQNTSFNTMKKEASEPGQSSSDIAKMFRKGQVGDWKNHLTVAQSELIDAKVKKILGDTGINFIYELDNQ